MKGASSHVRGLGRVIGLLAAVADASAEGDAKRGKVLAYTCHGCHGVPDYKNAFPNYSVPKLGGQNAPVPDQRPERLRRRRSLRTRPCTRRPRRCPTRIAPTSRPTCRAKSCSRASRSSARRRRPRRPAWPATAPTARRPSGPTTRSSPGSTPTTSCTRCKEYKSGKRKNPIMAGIIAGMDAKDFEAHRRVLRPAAGPVQHRRAARTRQVRPRQ